MANNSPLESLAAFAITFAAGVASTIALTKYIVKIKKDAKFAEQAGREHQPQ